MTAEPSNPPPTSPGRRWLYLCRRCGKTAEAAPRDLPARPNRERPICCGEGMTLTLQRDRQPDPGPGPGAPT